MKATLEQLRAKIAGMPRAELEMLAENIIVAVYGATVDEDGDKLVLDQNAEWTQDNIENVAEYVDHAGLNPDKLGEVQP